MVDQLDPGEAIFMGDIGEFNSGVHPCRAQDSLYMRDSRANLILP